MAVTPAGAPAGGVTQSAGATRAGAGRGAVVVEARGISKTFVIPEERRDTFKERVTHPFARIGSRELRALRDVSFDVHRGEFFGIVGRNGSGKSTLLKILAGIYRPDHGRVRMAGRVAPFIELGVGFNPELTSRANIVLGGVLFGLSRREAERRIDEVLDFAELREYTDLKLKNYSSGMMVRLAFSIMVQSNTDIMLIDEVLAVGDAAFAQKCMDVFYARRSAGRTIVLVTHDMATVQSLCHRAMLLHDGELEYLGEPEDAALRYFRLNFAEYGATAEEAENPLGDESVAVEINGRLVDARLLDAHGDQTSSVEQGDPLRLDIHVEAARELQDPTFLLHIVNDDHVVVSGVRRELDRPLLEGERVHLTGTVENRLVPGRYFLDLWIRRSRTGGEIALQCVRLLQFVVFGTGQRDGLVVLETTLEAAVEPARP